MKCVCIFDVHVFYRRDVCRSESKKKIFTKFCPEMDSCLKKKTLTFLYFLCVSHMSQIIVISVNSLKFYHFKKWMIILFLVLLIMSVVYEISIYSPVCYLLFCVDYLNLFCNTLNNYKNVSKMTHNIACLQCQQLTIPTTTCQSFKI